MSDSQKRNTALYQQQFPPADKLCEYYDQWASTYDEEAKQFGWDGPKITANSMSEFVTDKNAKILDLASGTGLVGEELKTLGYTNIDGLDMSSASLKISEQKQVYKKLMCINIRSDAAVDVIADNTYDALVSCGSFSPESLNQSCFPDIARIVKPGGIIVIIIREDYLRTVDDFNDNKFEDAIRELVDRNAWTLVSRQTHERFLKDLRGLVFVFKVLL